MAIMAMKPPTNGTYTPAPEGVHDAVCCDVVDEGVVEFTWQGETNSKHQVRLVWQLAAKMEDGRPFSISNWYNLTLHEKSNLFKDLRTWFGKAPPDNFDLEKLIGHNCQIVVVHNERDGNTRAKVQSVLKAGNAKLKVTPDYVRFKDREPRKDSASTAKQAPINKSAGLTTADLGKQPRSVVSKTLDAVETDADGNDIPF